MDLFTDFKIFFEVADKTVVHTLKKSFDYHPGENKLRCSQGRGNASL